MSKYRVHFTTGASASVTVDIDDALDDDPEEAREQAIEAAYDALPGEICARCSGWGQPWSRDLGDWEIEPGPTGLGDVEKIEG